VADAAGTTAFTYNTADQVATVDDPFVTGTPVSTYAYDVAGRPWKRTDAQATLRWERTFESITGRLDTQVIKNDTSGATLASFDLGYDLSGNVISKASSVFSNPANGTWAYFYDGASRLIQATGPNATGASTVYDYAYDGGGNRIVAKETTGSVVKNLSTTYDAAGLPTSATDAATGESLTYTHDQVGNLTQIDSSVATNDWTSTFDAFSRLTCSVQGTSCASGSTRVLFALDALDRARTRSKGSVTKTLTYQGISEQVAETVEGSTTTTYASTAGGAPLAEKTGSTTSFYLRDPHGDVVGLASTAAANQGTASFDPYGRSLATTGTTSFLGYQGDITDPDTKQVDMGTRWYAAGLGRFTSRDVLFGEPTSPMTLNQHVYGGLNPITMWDPTGMGQCSMAGECVTYNDEGDKVAVGGNVSSPDHPMHDQADDVRSVSVTPRPPRPDPLVRDADFVSDAPAAHFRDKGEGRVCPGYRGPCGIPGGGEPFDYCLLDPTCLLWRWSTDVQSHAAREWAMAAGGNCERRNGGYWMCVGAETWTTGPRAALTLGDTVISDSPLEEGSAELEHELGHVRQARALGPFYVPSWIIQEIGGRLIEPTSSDCNTMEIDAGPGGGYGACDPWWS
jgi:RHS repeat-associated protein